MAGAIRDDRSRRDLDSLFDLTPEDDVKLRESDLLDLVNYGQVVEPVRIPGANGSEYRVGLALLWDEDWINILKQTMPYATDPVLRVRTLRRLKLHQAIQFIDDRKYDDPTDVPTQRELWTILLRLADVQIDILDAEYSRIEITRNMEVSSRMRELSDAFMATAPESTGMRKKEDTPAPESTQMATPSEVSHEEVMAAHQKSKEKEVEDIKEVLETMNVVPVEGTVKPTLSSQPGMAKNG